MLTRLHSLGLVVLILPMLSCLGPGITDGSGDSASDDACASVTCEGNNVCVDGVCVPDDSAPECTLDTDCAENWVCDSGACVPDASQDTCASVVCEEGEQCVDGLCVEADSDLEAVNPGVDFSNLGVGETYPVVAPDPTVEPGETDESGDTDESDETEVSDQDGETLDEPAGRPAPADCSCLWTALPETSVDFAPADDCNTLLTPAQEGDFTVAVNVTCTDSQGRFTSYARAITLPTPCSGNDDCTGDEMCTDGVCVPRTGPIITLISELSRSPFLVAFDLRLEDMDGMPIHESVTRDQFRIFEDGREIDYTETGYAVTPAPNLPLKVVLVLDYTVSMSDANAIGSMVSAAGDFVKVDHFTATHHIGVVEFHDRTGEGEGYGIVSPLTRADTEGKSAVLDTVPDEGTLEPGLSRAWDAVGLAVTMLGEVERQPGEVQAIVFLTDGRDTTSETSSESILTSAVSAGIMLYPIGFGDVADGEAFLQSLAEQTDGTYFSADDADALGDVFEGIADDLQGQWTLSYITQRNSGTVATRVEFDWLGETASFETDVSAGNLDGDVHAAVVEILDRAYDDASDRTNFLLRAAYVPRNIWRFRFFVAQESSTFTLQTAGGLTSPDQGWVIVPNEGTYDLVGSEPLDHGSFGNIGIVTLPGNVERLQIMHDDSVYDSLSQPKTLTFEGTDRQAPALLTLSVEPPGAGAATAVPDKPAYALGEEITLIAGSLGDYVFDAWGGNATGDDYITTLTMDGDKSAVARFFPPRVLSITIEPTGSGTVTQNPDRTTYRHGEVVVLTATATAGYSFTGWSGSATGTESSLTMTMDADKTLTATFAATQ